MSTAVAKTLPVGPCQVYWNDVRLGSPRSQANVRWTKNTVQAGLQEFGMNVLSHKTGEECEVDIRIADFKPSQLRYVYDKASDYDALTTLDTNSYTATGSVATRFHETHKLSGTADATVDQASFDTGTITVSSSDYETEYTSGTDFTSDNTAGTLARIAAGDISDQEVVIVEYNEAVDSGVVYAGGGLADFEATLRLSHILPTKKTLSFYGYRAAHIGASETAINMEDEYDGIPMTFHLLADLSRTPGQQLFRWAVES